jgi:MFS family permease
MLNKAISTHSRLRRGEADTPQTRAVPITGNESGMAATAAPAGRPNERTPIGALLPIMAAVSIAFLVIGFALPVLPLHVHHGLGLGTFVVGLVTGSQFAASLFSRVWAGHFADRRGAKRAVIAGLLAAVLSGGLYLVSLAFTSAPQLSVGILLAGRALLGAGESFVITGAVAWGLALAGPQHAGRVIAWVGMAMFAAMALGAPIGTTLYGHGGFLTVALATAVIPLFAVLLVAPLAAVAVQRRAPAGLIKVLGAVWMPGLGSALGSVGFGAMLAFSSLLATGRGWSPVWLSFSAFAFALVAVRLLLGHVPDRLGGAKVALVCVFVEALGLMLIWFAQSSAIAALGAAFAGFGYSLLYPSLGVEAVRRAPPQSRGLAMGAYTVCLDIALGFSSPALGLIAGWFGLSTVFLASALIVCCAAGVAVRLLALPPPGTEPP